MLKRWVKDVWYLIKWNQTTGRSSFEYKCANRNRHTPKKGKTGKILAYSDKVVGLC